MSSSKEVSKEIDIREKYLDECVGLEASGLVIKRTVLSGETTLWIGYDSGADVWAAQETCGEMLEQLGNRVGTGGSGPNERANELRRRMVSESDGSDLIWWWKEAEQALSEVGHGGYSKPVYYTALEDAATAENFEITTKLVYKDGRKESVKAIRYSADGGPQR